MLRAPLPDDAATISGFLADWEVARWLVRVPNPYRVEHAAQWIARASEERAAHIGWPYLIVLREDGMLPRGPVIGSMDLSLEDDTGAASLGYWLAQPYWGSGYAVEAAKAAIDFAFETLGLLSVTASAVPDNRRSIRVLQKSGFAHIDRRMEKTIERGDVEIECFVLTRADWRAMQ